MRIVAESYESGEPVSAVARRHALTAQQLFGWRRAARRRVAEESGAKGAAFAPVIVEATPPCAEAPIAPAAHAERSPIIEIAIGIARVWIPPGIDPVTLTAVLRAVRATT